MNVIEALATSAVRCPSQLPGKVPADAGGTDSFLVIGSAIEIDKVVRMSERKKKKRGFEDISISKV